MNAGQVVRDRLDRRCPAPRHAGTATGTSDSSPPVRPPSSLGRRPGARRNAATGRENVRVNPTCVRPPGKLMLTATWPEELPHATPVRQDKRSGQRSCPELAVLRGVAVLQSISRDSAYSALCCLYGFI